jgi:tellurite resistance protein TerC
VTNQVLLWVGFNLAIVGLLMVDLLVIHRAAKVVRPREAGLWTLAWVTLSLLFCGGIALFWDHTRAVEFLTGYLVEYALSVDNLFVFLMVFTYFRVAPQYQHNLLFWGVLGAFVMRASLIVLGTALVSRFHWVLYLFGAFLVFTGLRMLLTKGEESDPEVSVPLRLARRFLKVSRGQYPGRFFVREDGKVKATPLVLVVFVVELTVLIFALDSIPAVMGITQNAFIVYSSNVCAILGLRSLFFVISSLMDKFRYLKIGLSIVLCFVGLKLLLERWFNIPVGISLAVVAAIIVASILASAMRAEGQAPAGPPEPPSG